MARLRVASLAAACALTLLLGPPAKAERTLTYGIHAVPAPPRVTVDGDLAEWDRSGEIICCKDVNSLLEVESVRISAMWDEESLYIGVAWRDPSPMQNKVDPVTMAGNGWRSDCLQLRSNMAGFVSHVDCWYYTPGKRPGMTIAYGRIGVEGGGQPKVDRPQYPEKLGAEQAFRRSADGAGYVQEIRIPWAVLTLDGKTPSRDADLRLGVEFFWGDVSADNWPKSRVTDNLYDGETQTDFFWTNVKAWGRLVLERENDIKLPPPTWMRASRAEPGGTVAIEFRVPREAFVTIALEDERGNRVKSLVGGVNYPAGRNAAYWSGLDDRNELLPPGRYRWRGLYRDKISVKWLMSFYQANRAIPWTNAQGTGAWGPDHGNLLAAAAGGGRVYLGGLGAEAGLPLFAVDEAGTKVWSGRCGEPDRLAFAGGILYAHTSKGDSNWLGITPRGIMHFEAETGRWLDISGPDGKPTRRLPLLGKGEVAAGLAADAGAVYVSVSGKSSVKGFDRETFSELREYSVPGAGELFSVAGKRLLVVTPEALVALDPRSGKTKDLAQGEFASARAVTADAGGRTVYVALGAPLHQVHVYRVGWRGAKKTREIGIRGGRTRNGRYDPAEGFLDPSGLAVDSEGRLWVVENDQRPKRVSVWQDGEWVRDFIGDTGYGGGGVINPLDPTEAFYRDMRFEIDLGTGQWRLTHVGFVIPEGAERLGMAAGSGDHATGSDVDAEHMMAYRGRACILKCRGSRHVYRKCSDGRWALCVFIDPQKRLAWMDRNDDCKVQEREVVRGRPGEEWGGTDYWGMRPSQEFDMYFTRGVQRPGLRLRLQGVTPGGTPLYDFTKFEEMAGECMNGVGLRGGDYNSGCAGERGEYFSEMRRIHGAGVPRRTFWFRGEKTGRWTSRMPAPGVVLYPFQAHGVADLPGAGEVVMWVSDFGQRYLFTEDMLYVDQLFADSRACRETWPGSPERGFVADAMSPGQESFHGYFTRLLAPGPHEGRYILTTGFTDCRVFEVTGLDSVGRIKGEVVLKPGHLARAREIQAFRRSGGEARGKVTIRRVAGTTSWTRLRRVAAPATVDGSLEGWSRETACRIEVDADRSAEVVTGYDERNLYVAWDVEDPNPMRNGAQDWRLAFKGGDAVDVMFRRPGPDLDNAQTREGDVRILIAELDGQLRTVLYRPVSARKAPHLFDAFEGAGRANAVRMDEVRLAGEVDVVTALRRRSRVRDVVPTTRKGAGYVVEAAIPWRLLGASPKKGAEARIDFGVLFSDPEGSRTVVRAYWENRDTNIVSDIPSEAALAPARWGVAEFGD